MGRSSTSPRTVTRLRRRIQLHPAIATGKASFCHDTANRGLTSPVRPARSAERVGGLHDSRSRRTRSSPPRQRCRPTKPRRHAAAAAVRPGRRRHMPNSKMNSGSIADFLPVNGENGANGRTMLQSVDSGCEQTVRKPAKCPTNPPHATPHARATEKPPLVWPRRFAFFRTSFAAERHGPFRRGLPGQADDWAS